MDNGLQLFWSIVYGAIAVEAVVNIIKQVDDKNKSWKYWASLAFGLALGVAFAIIYDIDLFKLVGLEASVPVFGAVLTGLIIGRGSNVVQDVIDKLNAWRG